MSYTGNISPLHAPLIIGCVPAVCQFPSGQHASQPLQLAPSTSNAASRPSVGLVHHSALRRPLNEYVADRAPRLLQLPARSAERRDRLLLFIILSAGAGTRNCLPRNMLSSSLQICDSAPNGKRWKRFSLAFSYADESNAEEKITSYTQS